MKSMDEAYQNSIFPSRNKIGRLKSKATGRFRDKNNDTSLEDTYDTGKSKHNTEEEPLYDHSIGNFIDDQTIEGREDLQDTIKQVASERPRVLWPEEEGYLAQFAETVINKYNGEKKDKVRGSEYDEDIREVVNRTLEENSETSREKRRERALTAVFNRYDLDYSSQNTSIDQIETGHTSATEYSRNANNSIEIKPLLEEGEKVETTPPAQNGGSEGIFALIE